MERRKYLKGLGAGITLSLSGCASSGSSGETESEGNSPTTVEGEMCFSIEDMGDLRMELKKNDFADAYPDNKPSCEIVVGERPEDIDNPHGVRIYNRESTKQTVTVESEVGDSGDELVFTGESEVEAEDGYIAIALWEPMTYEFAITADSQASNPEETFTVQPDAWERDPDSTTCSSKTTGLRSNILAPGNCEPSTICA